MATVSLGAGVSPPLSGVLARIEAAAAKSGSGNFVISSGVRTDSTTFHRTGNAADISVRQSTGNLWRLFFNLVREGPTELFYKSRLLDEGTWFDDAELSASHEDHIHVAWRNPGEETPASGPVNIPPGLVSTSGGLSITSGTTWIRFASGIGGFLLLVGGGIVLMKEVR